MKKTDFIFQMIASHTHIFTNPAARKANVADAIQSASSIYDEAERQIKELALDEKPKSKAA